jgi:hypothetical protein
VRKRHPNKPEQTKLKPGNIPVWTSPQGNKFTVIVKVSDDGKSAVWTAYDLRQKKIASGPMQRTMSQTDAKDLNDKIKRYVDVIVGVEKLNTKQEIKNEQTL